MNTILDALKRKGYKPTHVVTTAPVPSAEVRRFLKRLEKSEARGKGRKVRVR